MESGKSFTPFAFSGLLAMLGITIAATCSKLPDRLATHFNANGTADGWMDKSSFLPVFAGTAIGISALVPVLFMVIRWLPAGALNIPNKAYWLSAEQSPLTFRYLSDWGFTIGACVAAFQIQLYLLVIRANHSTPPVLSPGIWIGGFLLIGVVLIQVIRLYVKFSNVPQDHDQR